MCNQHGVEHHQTCTTVHVTCTGHHTYSTACPCNHEPVHIEAPDPASIYSPHTLTKHLHTAAHARKSLSWHTPSSSAITMQCRTPRRNQVRQHHNTGDMTDRQSLKTLTMHHAQRHYPCITTLTCSRHCKAQAAGCIKHTRLSLSNTTSGPQQLKGMSLCHSHAHTHIHKQIATQLLL